MGSSACGPLGGLMPYFPIKTGRGTTMRSWIVVLPARSSSAPESITLGSPRASVGLPVTEEGFLLSGWFWGVLAGEMSDAHVFAL
jgi:hypothetical protein